MHQSKRLATGAIINTKNRVGGGDKGMKHKEKDKGRRGELNIFFCNWMLSLRGNLAGLE